MFDAKSLLESLIGGARDRNPPPPPDGAPHGDPLSDLLKSLTPGSPSERSSAASVDAPDGSGRETSASDGLSSIFNELGIGRASGNGNVREILAQIFSQATTGVREGASKVDQSTGIGNSLHDAIRQLSGKSPEEVLARVRELVASNQLGTGAVLGGLGGLLIGTGSGRSIAANAAKIGAIALIGGLAYRAYQNYQQGRPLLTGGEVSEVSTPPEGSGFEPEAVSNDESLTIIRAMVASAAADGRIGEAEQQAIIEHLGGLNGEAEEFLASELNNPATADEIAAAVTSKEEATRVYTAARLAIDPDSPAEQQFLNRLAARLDLEPELTAHIDAATRGAEA